MGMSVDQQVDAVDIDLPFFLTQTCYAWTHIGSTGPSEDDVIRTQIESLLEIMMVRDRGRVIAGLC